VENFGGDLELKRLDLTWSGGDSQVYQGGSIDNTYCRVERRNRSAIGCQLVVGRQTWQSLIGGRRLRAFVIWYCLS